MNRPADGTGCLYIVATPIGNLGDLSPRAVDVLGQVDLIAAEDTRHSKKLLAHFGVGTRLIALHDHNERDCTDKLLALLSQGQAIAVISDAGTPLISDPGFVLVRAARAAGIRVVAIPGPSALIAALSVAGLPTDRFRFEGFLPAKSVARRTRLGQLAETDVTLVFYESSHRIVACLEDMRDCFGADREAVVARELTKTFETVRQDSLGALCEWLVADADQQRGEFVVLVHGVKPADNVLDVQARRTLEILAAELPLKQASKLAADITGAGKNDLYDFGLLLKDR